MNQEVAIYEIIGGDVRDLARAAAQRIVGIQSRLVSDIIAIGKELIAVKEAVGHGNFMPWLKAEFDWTERTAQNFMAVAERFGSNPKCVSHLPLATVYKLAAPSTPEPVLASFVSRIEAGESVKAWEVEGEIKAARRDAKAVRKREAVAKRRKMLSPGELSREVAKARAAEREREKAEQRRQARKDAVREVSAMIVTALGPDATRRAIDLLTTEPGFIALAIGTTELEAALKA